MFVRIVTLFLLFAAQSFGQSTRGTPFIEIVGELEKVSENDPTGFKIGDEITLTYLRDREFNEQSFGTSSPNSGTIYKKAYRDVIDFRVHGENPIRGGSMIVERFRVADSQKRLSTAFDKIFISSSSGSIHVPQEVGRDTRYTIENFGLVMNGPKSWLSDVSSLDDLISAPDSPWLNQGTDEEEYFTGGWSISFMDGDNLVPERKQYNIRADIISFRIVPEPSGLALLLSGLFVYVLFRRIKHRR